MEKTILSVIFFSALIGYVFGLNKEISLGYTQLLTSTPTQGLNVGLGVEKPVSSAAGLGLHLNYMNIFSTTDYLSSQKIDGLLSYSHHIRKFTMKAGAGASYHSGSRTMEWRDGENRVLGTYTPEYLEPVLSFGVGYSFIQEQRMLPRLMLEYKTGNLPHLYDSNGNIPDKNDYDINKLSLNLAWVL